MISENWEGWLSLVTVSDNAQDICMGCSLVDDVVQVELESTVISQLLNPVIFL